MADVDGVGGVTVLLSICTGKGSRDGVVGVCRIESDDGVGDARLEARLVGRNIPAPGIEVVKYRTLTKAVSPSSK